jgi:hypothetical protein
MKLFFWISCVAEHIDRCRNSEGACRGLKSVSISLIVIYKQSLVVMTTRRLGILLPVYIKLKQGDIARACVTTVCATRVIRQWKGKGV